MPMSISISMQCQMTGTGRLQNISNGNFNLFKHTRPADGHWLAVNYLTWYNHYYYAIFIITSTMIDTVINIIVYITIIAITIINGIFIIIIFVKVMMILMTMILLEMTICAVYIKRQQNAYCMMVGRNWHRRYICQANSLISQ